MGSMCCAVTTWCRQGHAQTVEKVLKWLDEEGGVKGITVADAGCGTGEAPP